ncbi:RNA-dependent RNA polymerase [Emaravirus cordylinae]|uniref:RNA-directed RNA polymerase L n=2 Tax=Emaravirus cordylinae TaxID=2099567 RepID=A0A513PVW1_9VIRU|nr:RNA-dependent RNA polymerase [Emaravirus cordylinae]QAB47307.1 RNA-dependent RNA polymerase [Emaravirus cordylinae]
MDNQGKMNDQDRFKILQTSEGVKFCSELVEIIKNNDRNTDNDNDIIDDFLRIIGKSRRNFDLLNRRKKVQNIYSDVIVDDIGKYSSLMDIAERIINSPTNKYLLDIVSALLSFLEMSRHDLMLTATKNFFIKSNLYKFVDQDFKLKDYFVNVLIERTPDILFKSDNEFLIVEIKVTVDSDLIMFYNKYKDCVGDKAKVVVINFNHDGLKVHGDNISIDLSSLIEEPEMEQILTTIDICKSLRIKYSQLPEFYMFSNFYNNVENDNNFISGFKDRMENLEYYDEVVELFGSKFNELTRAIESYDLITNEKETIMSLNSAQDDARMYCQNNFHHFDDLLKANSSNGLYSTTVLHMTDIEALQESKSLESYEHTTKLKPTLYIPMIKGSQINQDRSKYYSNHFDQDFKLSRMDDYTLGVSKLVNCLSQNNVMETILNKPKDETEEFLNSKYADLRVYKNNSFSLSNDHASSIDKSICGFEPKHNRQSKVKTCLSYKSSLDELSVMEALLKDMFVNRHNNSSYKRDLLDLSGEYEKIPVNTLKDHHQNNYLDYLFIQHNVFKSMIGLSKVSNKKYRLIQTADPNTLIVLLPNADSLKGAPLRYFTLSIISNSESQSTIRLNKLLGIYNSHLIGNKSTIMISKVISLTLNRLKLLSNSFAKYCQLVSYYSNLSNKSLTTDTHTLCLLASNLITISSLSLTDTFKNIMMVCYSTFSNPDELINDKLECRPTNMGHIFLMKRMFSAIMKSNIQRSAIITGLSQSRISEDSKELKDTGFDSSLSLEMPISKLVINNPKELIHECYMLFYLGNKGLHGSPQELLNLYCIPLEFETEYTEFISKFKTMIQEDTKLSDKGFSYDAMAISAKLVYSQMLSTTKAVRDSIKDDLDLDSTILKKKQFTSTKSMVSDKRYYSREPKTLDQVRTLSDLEDFIKHSIIEEPEQFIIDVNEQISKLNKQLLGRNLEKVDFFGDEQIVRKQFNKIPKTYIKYVNGYGFIMLESKKVFMHPVHSDIKSQDSVKVFDNVIQVVDEHDFKTLRSIYESDYIDKNDIIIRIFYKDQRSFMDREIYTGNLTTRLCLYPIESLFKSINKRLPEEAITLSGEKKQKKMMDQRIDVIKKRKQYNRQGDHNARILSMSCDASKWSARDMMLKFLIPIAYNPYITKEEKYFYFFLTIKYYKKYIVLTDSAFYDAVRFHNPSSDIDNYERLTSNYTKNYQLVRSNWLQGNLNATSSFVHYCSAQLSKIMLEVINSKYNMSNHMNFMVHSDDSVYDFLLMWKNNIEIKDQILGTLLYTLIQWSTLKHCITINRKKTYISNFYKEFLSTTIIGDELFFFYLSDLLPISSDVTYDSPLEDLASYSGYINNAFIHACPIELIKISILLVNHLTMATYNLNISSPKSPYNALIKADDSQFSDLPIQLMPRYKLPIELAGLLPYYLGDAYTILKRIINRIQDYITFDETAVFEDLFDIKVISKYLEVEKDDRFRNYIKCCLLTCSDDILCSNPEDPYSITDISNNDKNLIAVMPNINETRLKRSHTNDLYKRNEENYRKINAVNPFWSICNPSDHDDIKSKIICNYTNKKFIDSLSFSRPQIDYARRIISSNSKMYKYTLDNEEELVTITDIYKKISDDALKNDLTSENLKKYIDLYLFTDKKVSSVLHIFYSKKLIKIQTRDRVNYKIVIPKSIYPSEYGSHSITTMMRDLLISRLPLDVRVIDPKCEKFLDISESILNNINFSSYDNPFGVVKVYEFPEDIDHDFIDYCNLKYKTTDYSSCLIPNQNIDNAFDIKIYNIKIKFMSLCVKYLKDITIRIGNKSHKINYTTPKSVLLTIDSFMKRDLVSSKLHISTNRSDKIEDYILNKFGMYDDENTIRTFSLSHKLKLSHEKLVYKQRIEHKQHEEINFLTFLKTKSPDTFKEMLESQFRLNGRTFTDIMLAQAPNLTDPNVACFLKCCNIINSRQLVNIIQDSNYIMNYWPQPSPQNKISEAIYNKRGVFLRVVCTNISKANKELYSFMMTIYRPQFKNFSGRPAYSVIRDLINKFRTDFKSKIAHAQPHWYPNNANVIYRNGLTLSTEPSKDAVHFCKYTNMTYNEVDIELNEDESGLLNYIMKLKNNNSNHMLKFLFRDRHIYNYDSIYSMMTKLRDIDEDLYSIMISETGILQKDKSLFGHEYVNLGPNIIINHLDYHEDLSGLEAFPKNILDKSTDLYKVHNYLIEKQDVAQLTDVEKALLPLTACFKNILIDEQNSQLTSWADIMQIEESGISSSILTLEGEITTGDLFKKIASISIDRSMLMEYKKSTFYMEKYPYPNLINFCCYEGLGGVKSKLLSMIYLLMTEHYISESSDFEGF